MSGKINVIKTVFSLAKLDGECRKKSTGILFYMVVLSLLIFLTVNSLISSIINSIEDIIHKPYGRMVSILTGIDTYEDEMEYYQEVFSEESGIGEIFWHTSTMEVRWNNSDILGMQDQNVMVTTKIKAMDDYPADGSTLLEKGEILIPKYLYGMGDYNNYTYADGGMLVGQQLIMTVKNQYTEEKREYSFKVAGTYDNVRASTGNNLFCLYEDDALEIYEFVNCYGEDEYIKETLRGYGMEDDKEAYDSLRQRHYIGFYINEGYSVSDVCDKIEKVSGEVCFPFYGKNETLIIYYEFVIYLSNIIVMILGTAAVIILVVLIVRDLKSRYGQIALRYACGYSIGLQTLSFIIEKIEVLIKSALTAIITTVILLIAGNYIIQNVLPFYDRSITLNIDWGTMLIVIASIVAGSLVCIICSLSGMRKLNITETLKREER